MEQDTKDVKPPEIGDNGSSGEQESKFKDLEKEELIDLLKRANAEAKNRRLTNEEIQEELNKFKKKEAKVVEDEKKKKGEYEDIISDLKKQISELEPKANQFDSFRQSEIDSAKEKLGDKWDDNWADLPLPSLKKIVEATSVEMPSQKKVGTDNPQKGNKEIDKVELSEKEKAEALERYPHLSEEKAFELHKQTVINRLKKQKKED